MIFIWKLLNYIEVDVLSQIISDSLLLALSIKQKIHFYE